MAAAEQERVAAEGCSEERREKLDSRKICGRESRCPEGAAGRDRGCGEAVRRLLMETMAFMETFL